MAEARTIIERLSRYLESPPQSYSCYEAWIQGEEETCPGISVSIRQAALDLIGTSKGLVLRSAIQALACVGEKSDIAALKQLSTVKEIEISTEASSAIARLDLRHSSIESLLMGVHDFPSFAIFAQALANEREDAARLERQNPQRYTLDGALGWKNGDISSFIYAGLSFFYSQSELEEPSWQNLAEFLYSGKVVE